MRTNNLAHAATMPAWIEGVLTANGLFCAGSGLVFILANGAVARFLGLAYPLALALLGLVLVAYGALLIWIARTGRANRPLTLAAALLDTAWVAGSYVLVLWGGLALTSAGNWAIILVAEIVSVFALAQYIAWWKSR